MENKQLQHLENISLFKQLKKDEFLSIANSLEKVRITANSSIFNTGDKGDCWCDTGWPRRPCRWS